jgi:hypothetical protein
MVLAYVIANCNKYRRGLGRRAEDPEFDRIVSAILAMMYRFKCHAIDGTRAQRLE